MTVKRADMRRTAYILSLLLVAMVALAPALAEARGGGGSSSGSRGVATPPLPLVTQSSLAGGPNHSCTSQPAVQRRLATRLRDTVPAL